LKIEKNTMSVDKELTYRIENPVMAKGRGRELSASAMGVYKPLSNWIG